MSRLGQVRHAADGQQDAGHEARAVGGHVADRERLADVAEDDLLVGHDPGSRTEWIGTSPSISSAVRAAVPDGASSLPGGGAR